MKSFKELNISTPVAGFEGTKIELNQLISREIIIHDYKIQKSKFPKEGKDRCLHMQIGIGEIKYVCFTPAITLLNQITQIDKTEFPIKTTIIKVGQRVEFS